MRLAFVTIALLSLTGSVFAMDGVNTDTGDAVTVDDGTVFTVDTVIPVFTTDGDEMDLTVQNVTAAGKLTTVDFIDAESGEEATVEFTVP